MSPSRNFRVITCVIAVFVIVTFLAKSQGSIGNPVLKAQHTSTGKINFDHQEEANTLQGKPHQGSLPPYTQAGKVGGNKDSTGKAPAKVFADKSTGGEQQKAPQGVDSDRAPGAAQVAEGALGAQGGQGGDPGENGGAKSECKETNFVVMIDAGSTGSRVHVYEFDTCQSPPALLKEHFEMLKPGLSSFKTDTVGAAKSLDPLLKLALESVPKEKQGCTPVAVKATAGLRLLGEEMSKNILAEVRNHLENDYPFAVVPGDGISIMDGRDEGVYAWVTANYLLGNIGSSDKVPTSAVFDLGGGSTQIVFEPEFNNNEQLAEGDHKYEFNFGGHKYTLYQFSHLGYGLMQGRNKINSLVVQASLDSNKDLAAAKVTNEDHLKDKKATVTINNPCIPPDIVANDVQVKVADDAFYLVNMKGPSVANGAQCRFLAEKVLNKETECTSKPCSFNGIYQPSLNKAFRKTSDMFVFSYFYDRTNPLGFPSSFTVEELRDLAKIVCNGDLFWKEALLDDHVKQLNEEPQWCLDLSFITAMLHTGYDIPLHRELKTANKIDNNELGWCLGASLPLLDKTSSGWKCSVKEVS